MEDKNKKNPFKNIGKWQKKVDEGVSPLFFTEPDNPNPPIEPFIVIDDHPNDEDYFAILKTTENGKYIRGGMLHFVFNGVDITTEINNAIFIDRLNNAILIKDYSRVVEEIQPVDPEERQYIILYSYEDEESGEVHLWEAMQGRIVMYDWIKENIDELMFDPENSFILVETVPYKDALTVAQFVRYIQNAGYVEDNFDIDDYIGIGNY